MTATARGGERCFAYLKAVCPREIGGFLPPSPISRQRPPAPRSPAARYERSRFTLSRSPLPTSRWCS